MGSAAKSALIIRPFGPEPKNECKSKPLSLAIRRASGDAKIRFSGLFDTAFSWLAFGLETFFSDGITVVSALGVATICSNFSSSSSNIAIVELTFTFSEPSDIKILPMMPSSTASNSMVALSVSISAKRSPDRTLSPSDTNHLLRVPSSMVGDSAGIRISIAIKYSLTVQNRFSGGQYIFRGY